ncbi:MAG: MFS transporter, partial [Caulobacter sp.]|nr:MFS transporter [Caulobacter sp.]
RGSALAVAGFAQWIANFAISFSFPIMKKISLPATYGFYAACALVSYFLVQKLIQETRGKELEAMEG